MELDDFRAGWKQPQPTEAAFNTAQLQSLLRNRLGLVETMRRNVRVEMVLVTLLVLAFPFLFINSSKPFTIFYSGFLVAGGIGQLYYYYYKLGVLRRMALVESDVRGHLQKLCTELRGLLRFFYRVSLGSTPVSLLVAFVYFIVLELTRPGGLRIKFLLLLIGTLLVFGAFLQVAAIYGTRWYLQRLYGQHLDRLENLLRELEE